MWPVPLLSRWRRLPDGSSSILLEPDAPDSLLFWGFFNSIFEQKEYGEGYMLEKLARDMLAKDEKLKEVNENPPAAP